MLNDEIVTADAVGMAWALEEVREGFEGRLLASLSAGVVAIDGAARVVALNPAARRILGLPGAASTGDLGRDCRELLAGQPELVRLLLEALERGSSLSRGELRLAGEPGAGASIGLSVSPVRDPQGRLCGAALLCRDLAPIERVDEQERLRDRLAVLGQMAAGLAHEIRNPLAGMEVLVGLLKRSLADRPEERQLLAELTGELRAVARTVEQGLAFVRPAVLEQVEVDPERVVEEALAAALVRVPFDGVVERAFEPGLPPLWADEEQLRTLLTNLVVNAIEAMAAGAGGGLPRLVLGLRVPEAANAELEISVTDTGPGVPPELREKVFYPFFTTRQRGSGVGLALAQKIAVSHSGGLELVSQPGAGATFRVRLPVGAPAGGAARSAPEAAGAAR